jgi:hypothetical protein
MRPPPNARRAGQLATNPRDERDVAIDKKAVDLLMRSEAAPFCITQGLSTRLKNGCGVVMAAHARAVERPKRCRWPLWGAVQAHSVAGLAGRGVGQCRGSVRHAANGYRYKSLPVPAIHTQWRSSLTAWSADFYEVRTPRLTQPAMGALRLPGCLRASGLSMLLNCCSDLDARAPAAPSRQPQEGS